MVLFVAALNDEFGSRFNQYERLVTGVGKINATYELTRYLFQTQKVPKCIVNIGSAGSASFKIGTTVKIDVFNQVDMDCTALSLNKGYTPLSKEPQDWISYATASSLLPISCGTSDTFIIKDPGDSSIMVYDMEAYALALVCKRCQIPFICLKYITDNLSGDQWEQNIDKSSEMLYNKCVELGLIKG